MDLAHGRRFCRPRRLRAPIVAYSSGHLDLVLWAFVPRRSARSRRSGDRCQYTTTNFIVVEGRRRRGLQCVLTSKS